MECLFYRERTGNRAVWLQPTTPVMIYSPDSKQGKEKHQKSQKEENGMIVIGLNIQSTAV